MKKSLVLILCFVMLISSSISVFAQGVTLYALDGRTLIVDEALVPQYTAEGMGWFSDKPVIMYALDGRNLTVAYKDVSAYKNVGWYLYNDLPSSAKSKIKQVEFVTKAPEVLAPQTPNTTPQTSEKTKVQYTDGTVVSVPTSQIEMYKALGWVVYSGNINTNPIEETVKLYNSNGETIVVSASEVNKYITAGWTKTNPNVKNMTIYKYDGTNVTTKEITSDLYNDYNKQGYYSNTEEAIYAYAAFGDENTQGATQLLEEKKYELAFRIVQNSLEKMGESSSEYVSMLHYLRSTVTTAWRDAAKSPLGYINHWFSEKDGKTLVVFEYRNVSNNRISSFRINFDICDKDGNVIETNSGSYYVSNLQMTPCDKKRVAWAIKSGNTAAGIKNLRVTEVVFSDNTKWTPTA